MMNLFYIIWNANPEIISGYEYILENIDTLKIIDARSEGEYSGTIVRAAQVGHIDRKSTRLNSSHSSVSRMPSSA